jgi:pantothenate kinase-related protein Tda10
MIYVKKGVEPRLLVIACAAANAAQELGLSIVITSGTDGQHMIGSRHGDAAALDFRTRNLARAQVDAWMVAMRRRLGPDYDLVDEVDHIHVEYDPRPERRLT